MAAALPALMPCSNMCLQKAVSVAGWGIANPSWGEKPWVALRDHSPGWKFQTVLLQYCLALDCLAGLKWFGDVWGTYQITKGKQKHINISPLVSGFRLNQLSRKLHQSCCNGSGIRWHTWPSPAGKTTGPKKIRRKTAFRISIANLKKTITGLLES